MVVSLIVHGIVAVWIVSCLTLIGSTWTDTVLDVVLRVWHLLHGYYILGWEGDGVDTDW